MTDALGILFTPWVLGPLNLVSGSLVYGALRREGPLHSWQLMIGGIF